MGFFGYPWGAMRILVVDDHALFRDGLLLLLSSELPQAQALSAGSVAEAVQLAGRGSEFRLVLLDLGLPDAHGVEALEQLRRALPGVPIVVLSGDERVGTAIAALESGADGYIPKSTDGEAITAAIRQVLDGNRFVPDYLRDEPLGLLSADPGDRRQGIPLTARQQAVLEQLALGLPNKAIGTRLGMAEGTVRSHVSAIFKALGVVNRTQAVAAARQRGLLLE